MNKIWNWIVSIPKDKLLHDSITTKIVAIAVLLFKFMGCENVDACAYGWGIGFAAGIIKEIYDELKKKSSDSLDWAADAISFTLMSIYSYLLLALW